MGVIYRSVVQNAISVLWNHPIDGKKGRMAHSCTGLFVLHPSLFPYLLECVWGEYFPPNKFLFLAIQK